MQMKYEERLIRELYNPDGYLSWKDSWPLSSLDGMAKDMLHFNRGVESQISSLFIFHQLAEEILNALVRYCNLIIRGSLYPIKMTESPFHANKDFSQILKQLEATIEFKNKSKIIAKSKKLNKLRNHVGHRLVKEYYEFDIENELKTTDKLYEEIFELRNGALDWIYNEIKRIKNRPELEKITENTFQNSRT